jgi:hypothetical protein
VGFAILNLKRRHWILFTLLGFALALIVSFAAFDAWLDSLWGRQTLERELGNRFGIPVRLQGGFNAALYPSIGVSGDGLEFGDSSGGGFFATSGSYQVALAIIPLFRKHLKIEGLEIADFRLALSLGSEVRVQVGKMKYQAFTGSGIVTSRLDFPGLGWKFEYLPGGFEFNEIVLEAAGQTASGEGCLLLTDKAVLNLNLMAGRYDLDAARGVLDGESQGESMLPVELNLKFSASELRAAGAVAHGARIQLGEEPDCSGLRLYNDGLEIE